MSKLFTENFPDLMDTGGDLICILEEFGLFDYVRAHPPGQCIQHMLVLFTGRIRYTLHVDQRQSLKKLFFIGITVRLCNHIEKSSDESYSRQTMLGEQKIDCLCTISICFRPNRPFKCGRPAAKVHTYSTY